jgi:hypothetical protein
MKTYAYACTLITWFNDGHVFPAIEPFYTCPQAYPGKSVRISQKRAYLEMIASMS